jgi:hypothetical protein
MKKKWNIAAHYSRPLRMAMFGHNRNWKTNIMCGFIHHPRNGRTTLVRRGRMEAAESPILELLRNSQ